MDAANRRTVDVETLTVGLFASNCFFLSPAGSNEVVVVDPGDDAARILETLARLRRRVAMYLVTHGHVDHVSALAEVALAHPAPIAMHPADASWAFTPRNSMPPYYPTPVAPPRIDIALHAGYRGSAAGLSFEVLETPGHSPGSVSFHFSDHALLFSGDVLFAGAVGRTDLPGGHAPTLLASIEKLTALPLDTVVYCGHGPETTIGEELRTNPYLKRSDWARR